jgi:AhpD family alkylhydroperoxidase
MSEPNHLRARPIAERGPTMDSTSAVERRRALRAGFRQLTDAAPEAMHGFGDLHRAAMAEGALTTAHKELIALAIGIDVGCSGCITLHVHDALRAGATRQEVQEAVGVALMMGGGRASVYATEALAAMEDFEAAIPSREV